MLEHNRSSLLDRLEPGQQAMLRSQAGTGAGDWLLAIPSSDMLRLPDNLFLLVLRRRVFLELPLAGSACKACSEELDAFGHHLLSCTRSGWLKRRAAGLEKAWVQVLSEAGANAQHRPLLRDLAIPGVLDTDSRQLDLVASGLFFFGGKRIVGDATLRSPVSSRGVPHGQTSTQGGAATTDGFIFAQARRDKAVAYPELAAETARHKFLVLGTEVGGRFSEECVDLIRKCVELKAQHLSNSEKSCSSLFTIGAGGASCLPEHNEQSLARAEEEATKIWEEINSEDSPCGGITSLGALGGAWIWI